VRVQKQRERRAERQRGVGDLRVGAGRDQRAGRLALGQRLVGGVEHRAEAADPGRNVDDRDEDRHVDQRVLDDGDQRGRADAGLVGVGRQDEEREDQRPVALDAQRREHDLHADELQRDVRHRRQQPRQRDHQRQPARAVAAAHEVRRRDVAVRSADRPQPRHDHEDQRIDHDRVRQREEADRPGTEDERGHRDEGVRGVEVAAEQKPRDHGPEAPATEPPLVEVVELRPPPAGGHEAEHGDEREERAEDDERRRVRVVRLPDRGGDHGDRRVAT
jgi:hypothetical protein